MLCRQQILERQPSEKQAQEKLGLRGHLRLQASQSLYEHLLPGQMRLLGHPLIQVLAE